MSSAMSRAIWSATLNEAKFDLPDWRVAGTVVPVFSLRSEGSFGVGDFGDLKEMVDWVVSTGQRALQVLPINDTTITNTWLDSYPYKSISIYALHPMFVDIRQLPQLEDKERARYYAALQHELNALPQIDYERVNAAKRGYLRELFEQDGAKMMRTKAFKTFFDNNKDWLVPYAAFCHYRDLYGTATFGDWPDHHTFDESEREAMANSRTSPLSERTVSTFANLSVFLPLWKPKFSKTEKGASTERQFTFIIPVCLMT